MVDLQQIRRNVHKRLNLDPGNGVIGSLTGAVYVLLRPGYIYAREYQAGGQLGPVKEILLGPNINIPLKPGMPVLFGYNYRKEKCILAVDEKALIAAGGNPLQLNPLDSSYQYSKQDSLVTALCVPDTGLTCQVKSWIFVRNRVIYRWGNPALIDLSGSVPGTTNYHCIAGVFVLDDGTATEVKASTAKSQLAPLTLDDVQECITASSTGSTPIWFWRLYNGQTQIKDSDQYLDGRNLINVGMGDSQRALREVTAAGDVTVTKADDIVVINKSSGAATAVNLPASPATGLTFTIKDGKGDASSNNITITPAAGNIDGAGTYVISTNYGKATVTYTGAQWLTI